MAKNDLIIQVKMNVDIDDDEVQDDEAIVPKRSIKDVMQDDGVGGASYTDIDWQKFNEEEKRNMELRKTVKQHFESLESACDCGGFKEYKSMDPIFHYDWCKSRRNEKI